MKKFILITFLLLLIPFASKALSVSPPVIELEIEPSQQKEFVLKIFNETNQRLFLSLDLSSFKSSKIAGQANIDPEKEFKQYFSWFGFDQNAVVLDPLELKTIRAVANVPENATPGDYYLSALWQSTADKGTVGILTQVGHLVFLRVSGQVDESAQVVDFSYKKMKSKFSPLPVVFNVEIKNTGNVYIKPQGEIIIKNKFGFLSKILKVNTSGQIILPGESRTFTAFWENPWQKIKDGEVSLYQSFPDLTELLVFGTYNSSLKLDLSKNGNTITKDLSFSLFSAYFIILLIIIALLIILVIILNKKWKDTYKKTRQKKKK